MHTLDPTISGQHPFRAFVLTASLSAAAILALSSLVFTEVRGDPVDIDWAKFGILAAALVACERLAATWVRFGPVSVVTPIWMFGFGLLLLGSPSLAVAAAGVGALVHAATSPTSWTEMIHRLTGVAISLSTAGLLMSLIATRVAITSYDKIPWDWAVAIAVGVATVLLLNALVSALVLSSRGRLSFIGVLRNGLALRVTAEGAMLSLAPIWVIALDFSFVLIPMLAVTTVLVFRSTREALERSHEAHHDALTGLVNRRAYLEALEDTLGHTRGRTRATALIMDLDGFKEVNDGLGHQMGDALLVSFARRLEQSVPDGALAARLGGDEFAVLLTTNASDDHISATVSSLHQRLVQPLDVDGFPVTVGVSIGVASSPDDGRTPSDLIRAADTAMYKAKRTRSAVEHYENCVKTPQRGRLNLLGDLSGALRRHQLHVHYQPQIRVSDGTVDTVEALVRWNHPAHGAISPTEFVGLAEQTDLIIAITDEVVRQSTRAMATADAHGIRLAINVSPRSLQDRSFAPHLLEVLDRNGFPPDRLELEVTERAIVTDAELSRFTISKLRAAGIRIAIDDFGVGYSSYQTLRVLDVDRVKIDREFVQGLLTQPRDRLIVSSLVRLAHDLGLDVVAEGVESTAIWDAVASLECDVAQGYGIAVPMALPELREWLSQWQHIGLAGDRRPTTPSVRS